MAKIKKIKLPNDNSPRDICDAGATRYDEAQALTDNQKTQARANIGAQETLPVTYDSESQVWVMDGGTIA